MHEFEIARKTGLLSIYTTLVIASSFAALALTVGVSSSGAELGKRTAGFAFITAAYLFACALVYRWHLRRVTEEAKSAFEHSIERVLNELEETHLLIAGSLKVQDLFRLVASRVDHLVGCSASVLLLLDQSRTRLEIAASSGASSESSDEVRIEMPNALADRCMREGSVVTAPITRSTTSVAVPLSRGTESFGVLQLCFDREPCRPLAEMQDLFEAVGVRVSALVLSSMVFERNQERALTDEMTDLPNERAFYLILEQQIAETERDRDGRPLSVLSIDVRDFDLITSSRGHATGDRVLNFVARTARENLRQMDFFARCGNDEFLAVLPTASEETAQEVVERIGTEFRGRKLQIEGIDPIEVRLNFGWAVFGKDGETAKELLAMARARRDSSFANGRQNTVLMFRK